MQIHGLVEKVVANGNHIVQQNEPGHSQSGRCRNQSVCKVRSIFYEESYVFREQKSSQANSKKGRCRAT